MRCPAYDVGQNNDDVDSYLVSYKLSHNLTLLFLWIKRFFFCQMPKACKSEMQKEKGLIFLAPKRQLSKWCGCGPTENITSS